MDTSKTTIEKDVPLNMKEEIKTSAIVSEDSKIITKEEMIRDLEQQVELHNISLYTEEANNHYNKNTK